MNQFFKKNNLNLNVGLLRFLASTSMSVVFIILKIIHKKKIKKSLTHQQYSYTDILIKNQNKIESIKIIYVIINIFEYYYLLRTNIRVDFFFGNFHIFSKPTLST